MPRTSTFFEHKKTIKHFPPHPVGALTAGLTLRADRRERLVLRLAESWRVVVSTLRRSGLLPEQQALRLSVAFPAEELVARSLTSWAFNVCSVSNCTTYSLSSSQTVFTLACRKERCCSPVEHRLFSNVSPLP